MGMTARIFRPASDDDIISWQEDTKGNLFLYYRQGVFCLAQLNHWQEYAQRTAISTFARTTSTPTPGDETSIPTPSYQVRYGDIPEPSRMFLQLPTTDSVALAFYQTLTAPPGPLGHSNAEIEL